MIMFALGLAVGVIAGGWIIDLNLRAPEPVKKWLASWFPTGDAK